MKKKFILYFLLFLLVSFFLIIAVIEKRKPLFFHNIFIKNELIENKNEKVLGILYKRNPALYDTIQNFKHLVLRLNDDNSLNISNRLITEIPEEQNILLSIEFWGNKYLPIKKNDILEEIINGSLDEKLQKIYNSLLNCNRKIFVSINPEMELWYFKFPWYNCYKYIEAYRHVALFWQNRNLKFVWGHSGFSGAERFYPGDDVVDFISFTLYPTNSSDKKKIHRNLHRLRFLNKPILIMASEKMHDNKLTYNNVTAEIDSIAKYRNIAYNDSLWKISKQIIKNSKFLIGLHDPRKLLLSDPAVSIEHIFVSFDHVPSGELKRRLDDAFSRNHDAVLTVEPWSEKPDSNILVNIINGKYDSIINHLYKVISDKNQTVYLRFAHEMEIPITRYPWQSQDPLTYISAFRHFMQFPKQLPVNVKRVWGPAGDSGSSDFYPGDDVVDYVSVAVYALPDKNITDFERQFTFNDMFIFKTSNVRFLNKPIFITEFGVKGPEEYKALWLEDAARILNKNPQVVGINYFNMSDTPGAWGDIKAPDWSITPKTLHRFLDVLIRDDD